MVVMNFFTEGHFHAICPYKPCGYWQVNYFMKGGGTDAPEEEEEEEEEPRPSVSYDDMWAKTLLDGSDSSVILSH